MRTLPQLKDSRFGQPWPRHGLRLLWWFANECVQIDKKGRLVARCNPANGAFGFHRFHNRNDGGAGRLLPFTSLPYYEVGNLRTSDTLLPPYVTEYYTGDLDNSNTDRIIVCLKGNCFEKIYVTQHSDQVNFDRNLTYEINPRLIKEIRRLRLEEFLQRTVDNQTDLEAAEQSESYSDEDSREGRPFLDSYHVMQTQTLRRPAPPTRCDSKICCPVLICVAVALSIIGGVIYGLSSLMKV